MAKIVEFERAEDPRDIVHQVVQALAEGQLVGFATDTLYVATAHPFQAAAIQRLAASCTGDIAYLALRSPEEALDYAPVSDLGRKLIRRTWPGPLVLAIESPEPQGLTARLPRETRDLVVLDAAVAMRAIPQPVLAAALKLSPAPLVVSGEGCGWRTAGEMQAAAGEWVDLIIDQGPARFGQAATVARVGEREWTLLREGKLTGRTLNRLAGQMFLFVCTGNTCRSPMAEAIFRNMLSRRLNCGEEDLIDRGYIVQSAGLAAGEGHQASPESVQILADKGVDLRGHSSQAASTRLLQQADRVFTMTRQHRDLIVRECPELAPRVELLARDGSDVLDPIGFGIDEYEKCANQIEEHLKVVVEQVLGA